MSNQIKFSAKEISQCFRNPLFPFQSSCRRKEPANPVWRRTKNNRHEILSREITASKFNLINRETRGNPWSNDVWKFLKSTLRSRYQSPRFRGRVYEPADKIFGVNWSRIWVRRKHVLKWLSMPATSGLPDLNVASLRLPDFFLIFILSMWLSGYTHTFARFTDIHRFVVSHED